MCFTESLKNQNKNFVRKINHEYFGGSDVTNASYNQKSDKIIYCGVVFVVPVGLPDGVILTYQKPEWARCGHWHMKSLHQKYKFEMDFSDFDEVVGERGTLDFDY